LRGSSHFKRHTIFFAYIAQIHPFSNALTVTKNRTMNNRERNIALLILAMDLNYFQDEKFYFDLLAVNIAF